ncbi:hypothetical protein E2C01_017914 [Portunus trituberculatus]|uniref:Uncharacterized protein n=1 Tax=Portunus trituberculatus TaxID=210409 RepID=A0A5B7DT69_PORTR|nr:hypothetical protein [Portunus trituberculatus]
MLPVGEVRAGRNWEDKTLRAGPKQMFVCLTSILTMLFRVLPRTFDLWGVRSPATLPFSTVTRKATHYLLWFKRCPKPQSGLRCLSSGHTLGCRDPGDYASDPQVKEWLKELHKDFSHQPQQEILSSSKAKEGKEKTKEEGLASDMAEKEKRQEERKEGGSNPVKVWSRLVAEKYQKLDTHTQIIYDYDEEQQRREAGLEMEEVVQGKQEKVKLMRNIILHIMRPKTREIYDLETLWTVGAEFDERSQVTEEDLVGVHKPRDPLAPPPPAGTSAEAVT